METKSNRKFLIVICALFILFITNSSNKAFAHGDLVFTSWSGPYMRSQILGFVKPYESQSGKSIDVEHYSGGINEIRDQVESANIKWDVVDLIQ